MMTPRQETLSRMIMLLIIPGGSALLYQPSSALAQPTGVEALSQDQQLELAKLLRQARLAYQQGDFDDAMVTYQRAYAILPQPDILYQIALCHDKSERLVEARDAYRDYLLADEKSNRRGQVKARIETLNQRIERARLGALTIAVRPEQAAIFVDDERLTERPARLGALEPGRALTVRVEAPGYTTSQTQVEIKAGQTQQLDISLTPLPAEAPEERTTRGKALWWVAGVSGAGALGLGAANVLGARRVDAQSAACRTPGDATCPYTAQEEVREELDAARRRHNIYGFAAMGLGAVALTSSLFAWRAGSAGEPSDSRTSLHLGARSIKVQIIW